MIAMPMPASPQNSSSLTIGSVRPVGSTKNWAMRLEAVEADLRRLLDDRPGRLLALVPLGGGRAHDVSRRSRGPSRGCPSGPGSARARTGSRSPRVRRLRSLRRRDRWRSWGGGSSVRHGDVPKEGRPLYRSTPLPEGGVAGSAQIGSPPMTHATQPPLLWEPSEDLKAARRLPPTWTGCDRARRPRRDYDELWRWSVDDLEAFWSSIADVLRRALRDAAATRCSAAARCRAREWFPGATLSYPEHIFRGRDDDDGRDPPRLRAARRSPR